MHYSLNWMKANFGIQHNSCQHEFANTIPETILSEVCLCSLKTKDTKIWQLHDYCQMC